MTTTEHEPVAILPDVIKLYELEMGETSHSGLVLEDMANIALRDIRFRWQLPNNERALLSTKELLTLDDPISYVEALTDSSVDNNMDIVGYFDQKVQFQYYPSSFNQCDGENCNHKDKGFKYWDYDCSDRYEPSILLPLAHTALVISPGFSLPNKYGSTIGMKVENGLVTIDNTQALAQLFTQHQDTPIYEILDVSPTINTVDNTIKLLQY